MAVELLGPGFEAEGESVNERNPTRAATKIRNLNVINRTAIVPARNPRVIITNKVTGHCDVVFPKIVAYQRSNGQS
jgi:hypothetical protein